MVHPDDYNVVHVMLYVCVCVSVCVCVYLHQFEQYLELYVETSVVCMSVYMIVSSNGCDCVYTVFMKLVVYV